ncbi:MAG: HAMP domain-containing sensor histidine kinase [Actinomycetota bacterium]
MKLSHRLIIGLGAVTVAFAVTGFLIANTQRRYLTQQVDRQVQNALPLFNSAFGNRPLPPDGAGTLSEVYIGHLATDGTLTPFVQGQLVNGSPNVTPAQARAHSGPGPGQVFTVDGKGTSDRFRVVVFGRRDQPGWNVVALSLAKADSAYARLLIATAIGGAVVLAVIALTGAWVVRLGVKPINDVTAAADAISAGEKDIRVPSYPAGTEAARLAAAFNTMLDQKEASDERLRQFVADASHELRTPLTSIRGYADLYQQGGLTEQVRLDDAMRRVSGEAERMGSIVNDLLLLSKLDRHGELHIADIDLAPMLHEQAADARAVQPERVITVDTIEPLACAGDGHRLRQVVAALVHNALVHTPADTPIEVIGSRTDGAVVVEVIDHGPGMDETTAARAFERFFRGDPSRARQTGGSGLGLSIAQSIVDAHHGRLALFTAPGEGCRFRIALPSTGPAINPSSGSATQ